MGKKIIIPVVVIIILLIAVLVYMQKPTEPSIPVETPVPTETPTPTPEPTPTTTPIPTEEPTATEPPADTSGSGEYTIENYNKITNEEWAAMSDEEKEIWRGVYKKWLGGKSWDDLGHVTEEEAQDAIDSFNPDNPYIQDIIDSGVLDN